MNPKYFSYSWIKDNLTMVILVPTILGGIWQILELTTIDTPYLRFFSVTQLVSDGLMILFLMTVVYFVIWLTLKDTGFFDIFRKDPKEIIKAESKTIEPPLAPKPNLKNEIWYLLSIVVIFIGFMWAYWIPLYHLISTHKNLFTIEIVFIVFGVLTFLTILKVFISTLFDIFKWKIKIRQERALAISKYLALALVFGVAYGLIHLVPIMHRSYIFADDFKNRDYIACKIRKRNKNLKSFDIRYFNDKYIFVDIFLRGDTNLIEVMKFEEFLNDSACDVPKISPPVQKNINSTVRSL